MTQENNTKEEHCEECENSSLFYDLHIVFGMTISVVIIDFIHFLNPTIQKIELMFIVDLCIAFFSAVGLLLILIIFFKEK